MEVAMIKKMVVILAITVLSCLSLTKAGQVPALIVFGDSTVDAGNNNQISTLLKSNFLPYGRDFPGRKPTGRFSNGRVGTDFYSELYGLKPLVPAYLDPDYGIRDFAVGVCFASAGSGLDDATAGVLSVIPLQKQVEYFKEYQTKLADYLGPELAKHTISEAVYAISIGTNDFIENYYALTTDRFLEYAPIEYVDFLIDLAKKFVTNIYKLGARKIGFTGLGAMGCLPMQRSRNFMVCKEEYNEAARDFNSKLQKMAENMSATTPGLQLKVAHLYDFLGDIIRNPRKFGFENVEYGCCATGMFELGFLCNQWSYFTCRDANKYVFWDAVHPTEKTSRIIAEYLMNTTFSKFI